MHHRGNDRTSQFSITLAQLNLIVGDARGNAAKARAARETARADGADLLVLPELFLAGYPPEDLVLKPAFQAACRSAVEALARETADGGPAMLIGSPWVEDGKLYNACALLDEGRIAAIRFKANLPNYGVFDEKRLFARGPVAGPVTIRGIRVGVPICEDIWLEESGLRKRRRMPRRDRRGNTGGAERFALCLQQERSAAVDRGRPRHRKRAAAGLCQPGRRPGRTGVRRRVVRVECRPLGRGAIAGVQGKHHDLALEQSAAGWRCAGPVAPIVDGDKGDYAACVLGLRDYVGKNGFPGVLLGVSGGIDSALCAAIAVDALGAERVRGVMLPFRFTAQVSLDDAAKLAEALGIRYEVLPIAQAVNGFEEILSATFAGLPRDITEENLQARTRGTLLMAISNKTGAMVVTTGNKSEMSVGYATLYGDMNGGFNPIKDIYKTEVFRLSSLRNSWQPDGALGPRAKSSRSTSSRGRRPRSCAKTRPTRIAAALRMLDAILERLVEREEPLAAIVAAGFDPAVVARIDRLLNIAEYKRRQAAPGVKVTRRISGATAAIPSRTSSATPARRCPNPTTPWRRAQPADRRKRSRGRSFSVTMRGTIIAGDEGRTDRADRLVLGGGTRQRSVGGAGSRRRCSGGRRQRCALLPAAGARFWMRAAATSSWRSLR